ncbi:MAG TPA: YggT family protein [Bacillota bacterium]|nr:YggT family protein [Bacillota bacterium]HQJ38129.1 YggT family protein [Bacillota bacterium]HQL37480.1 YggT family protein [Bacillota bacterium]
MKFVLAATLSYFIDFLNFMILIRVLLSWFSFNPDNKIIVLIFQLTDPILEPFRKLTGKLGLNTGMIDFSPIISLLFLYYIAKPLLLTLIYTFL